jgi:hypothetical protein
MFFAMQKNTPLFTSADAGFSLELESTPNLRVKSVAKKYYFYCSIFLSYLPIWLLCWCN